MNAYIFNFRTFLRCFLLFLFSLKRSEGLAKLAKLRKNNFGVKPDCQVGLITIVYHVPETQIHRDMNEF